LSRQQKINLLEQEPKISMRRKCELLGLNRSGLYIKKKNDISDKDINIMNEIRDIYMQYSFFGYRKIHVLLHRNGRIHNRKKTQRLMKLAGLKAICPYKKNKQLKNAPHKIYPYLLKDIEITRPNQAWMVDITYIKIQGGFVYLVCFIDVYSRKIMGWNLSPFLDADSCIVALSNALMHGKPDIINSDQGCQFTSEAWCSLLISLCIQISMDGRGRWVDNIYVERLWRTIKYELIRLHQFDSIDALKEAIAEYIVFYNSIRPHQSLKYCCPNQVYEEFERVKKHENLEVYTPSRFGERSLLNFQ